MNSMGLGIRDCGDCSIQEQYAQVYRISDIGACFNCWRTIVEGVERTEVFPKHQDQTRGKEKIVERNEVIEDGEMNWGETKQRWVWDFFSDLRKQISWRGWPEPNLDDPLRIASPIVLHMQEVNSLHQQAMAGLCGSEWRSQMGCIRCQGLQEYNPYDHDS